MEVAHPYSGSSSTWFLVKLEFRNVGFWGEGKTGVPGEKLFGAKDRTTTTNLTHIRRRLRDLNPFQIVFCLFVCFFFVVYFNKFYFVIFFVMYYNFFYILTLMNTLEKYKKRKLIIIIYITHTHTHTHITYMYW